MSTYAVEGFKYLVVKTGYTARLFNLLAALKEKLKDEVYNDFCDCEANVPVGDKNSCSCQEDVVLFIEDSFWGMGVYEISEKKDEIDRIRSSLSKEEAFKEGIVVFRSHDIGNAMATIQSLMKVKYCNCFDFTTLCQMKVIDGEILAVEFGCESG